MSFRLKLAIKRVSCARLLARNSLKKPSYSWDTSQIVRLKSKDFDERLRFFI